MVIRVRRAGKNAGRAYERRDWLPANVLGGEASRQPDRLSEQQILQNVKQETLRLITAGDEDRAAGRAPIMELSDETYFYDPEGEWVVSSETTQYRNSRVHVETILRQRLRVPAAVLQQYPGMRVRGFRGQRLRARGSFWSVRRTQAMPRRTGSGKVR